MEFFKNFNVEFRDTLIGLLKPQAFAAGINNHSTSNYQYECLFSDSYSYSSVLESFISFSKGDYIIRKDEVGHEMYFICKGTAEVCSKDGKTIFKVLHDGTYKNKYRIE